MVRVRGLEVVGLGRVWIGCSGGVKHGIAIYCCWDLAGIFGEVRFWFRLCGFCMWGLRVGDLDRKRKPLNSTLVEEEV